MDFFILVTGTDAGEREDYMTEKIREYSMNGALIIGVDNGYGNMKTARRCFKTAIAKYDSAPVLSRDYIEYDGGYYVIGEGRKGFVADKQTDDDNYMLTLAAIVKELEARGMTDSVNRARIHLAVGLPLKWVQAQREDFKRYMLRNSSVEVGYKDRLYCIEFAGCTVMPQCYSAVTENLKDFAGVTLLADIGNGTMNLMYLNNGRPMESKGYQIKQGKHLAIKPQGMTRFRRCKSLGDMYCEEAIRDRIVKEDIAFYKSKQDIPKVSIVKCRVKRYRRAGLSGLQKNDG